jgi:uncharacterized FlaG/YvyC family protein
MLVEPTNAIRSSVDSSPLVQPAVKTEPPQEAPDRRPQESKEKEHVELLRDVLEATQNHLDISGVGLNFSVHEATGLIKVEVTDKETGDLIREIPPEQVLNLMAKIDEMMGILFDEKA